MWAKIIRHRLLFLIGVLVTAVIFAALGQADAGSVSDASPLLLGLLAVVLVGAGLVALNARHPDTFLVRDGTFTTPPDTNAVLMAGTSTVWPALMAGLAADRGRPSTGLDRFEVAVLLLLLVLVPVQWCSVLGPFGLSLRPDGVLDRQPLGSIFMPWEAGLAAEPTTVGVRIRLAHPELAVRRGFRPGTMVRTGADRGFTAWAINVYAARPEHRSAIGTADGLRQLRPL